MTDALKRNISGQQATGLLVHSLLNYWDASQIWRKNVGDIWRVLAF
jgi:hypothetical protein